MIAGKKDLPTPIPRKKGALLTKNIESQKTPKTLGIMGLYHPT